jgi:hypothetical protein
MIIAQNEDNLQWKMTFGKVAGLLIVTMLTKMTYIVGLSGTVSAGWLIHTGITTSCYLMAGNVIKLIQSPKPIFLFFVATQVFGSPIFRLKMTIFLGNPYTIFSWMTSKYWETHQKIRNRQNYTV